LVFLLASLFIDPARFFAGHSDGQGSFYAVIPHNVMAGAFGAVFLFVVLALATSVARFWRAGSLGEAASDALTLKYLDGGGEGCTYPDEKPSFARRRFHHLTFYGFMLCFAATCVATVYHYAFGWKAPYPFFSLPVLLGTLGGIGLLIGPAGLLWLRARRDPALTDQKQSGMDLGFLALLFLTSLTGLLLLAFRETRGMGTLLALHLGVVLTLFLTLPYGKFVHGFYRLAALARFHTERRQPLPSIGAE
jgi:citrate/tricarballylate utilization protein